MAQAGRRRQALADQRVEYLLDFFGERRCVDCGEEDPLVLQFDHLGDKTFNIGARLRDRPWKAILDEIAKCDVVCANCHRRRTVLRGGFARAVAAKAATARPSNTAWDVSHG
jgi:hypothetical protein